MLFALVIGCFFAAGIATAYFRWTWLAIAAAVIAFAVVPLFRDAYSDSGGEEFYTLLIAAMFAAPAIVGATVGRFVRR